MRRTGRPGKVTASPHGIARWVISMDRLLRRLLVKFVRRGTMLFTTADGETFTCGDGTGEPVHARFLTAEAERRVLLNPELALGEIYMEGQFVIEKGTIADALAILMDQSDSLPSWAKPRWRMRYLLRRLRQFNGRGRSRNNSRAWRQSSNPSPYCM